jgi:hypothetical protein
MALLNWQHETLSLRIGKGRYTFRTLSFIEANEVAPFIPSLITGAAEKNAPKMAEAMLGFLTVVHKSFVNTDDYLESFTAEHFDALYKFYARQDWAKIYSLVKPEEKPQGLPMAANVRIVNPPGNESEGLTNEQVFIGLCLMAAKYEGSEPDKFACKRFEYCADIIIRLRKEAEDRKHKEPNMLADLAASCIAGRGPLPVEQRN